MNISCFSHNLHTSLVSNIGYNSFKHMSNKINNDKTKLKAALSLLCEDKTTYGKVKDLSKIIGGLNPDLDKKVKKLTVTVDKLHAVKEGDVIDLTLENLPENTKKQKDRKKLILLLIKDWKNLKSEVQRLDDLYTSASSTGVLSKQSVVKTGKIAATAKGPLGVITIIAAVIVAGAKYIDSKSVTIEVINDGCLPIPPISERKINIPGLRMPSSIIGTNKSDTVKLPALKIVTSLIKTGEFCINVLGYSQNFHLPGEYDEITLNGNKLMGKQTEIDLSQSKIHELVISCK